MNQALYLSFNPIMDAEKNKKKMLGTAYVTGINYGKLKESLLILPIPLI